MVCRRTWLVGLGMLLILLSCAPTDRGEHDEKAPTPAPVTLAPLPTHLRGRIDAALEHVRRRDLQRGHSFWTVFHGILGVGPESAMLFDNSTGKREKALDYICRGGEMRGLKFVAIGPNRADVETMAGSGTGQGHQDQFIAEMAQWGMPRERRMFVQGKDMTFEAFILYSKERTSVKAAQELSWAIIIISQYFSTDIEWTNDRGEKLTFEDVVHYELTQPIQDSPVCGGTHRLFGLTWAYHLHMARGGKKTAVWQLVESTTRRYAELAKKLQNKDGSLSTEYLRGPGNNVHDLTLRIHSSGHVFEWLALALSDDEVRSDWMQEAAGAVSKMILENIDHALDGGALYHATHGLEIYRNRVFGPTAHPPVIPAYPK
jgi:hypothetical protein